MPWPWSRFKVLSLGCRDAYDSRGYLVEISFGPSANLGCVPCWVSIMSLSCSSSCMLLIFSTPSRAR